MKKDKYGHPALGVIKESENTQIDKILDAAKEAELVLESGDADVDGFDPNWVPCGYVRDFIDFVLKYKEP